MEAALAILRLRDFDPRTEAVVEEPVQLAGGGTPGAFRVVEYGARQLVLEVDTPAGAFLVTSETSYPGHAWIDGNPRAAVLTNVTFRGLPVLAGRHVVKMRFDPPVLWVGTWVTLAAACTFALVSCIGDAIKGVRGSKGQRKSAVT
jgi:hypothetical protein